ncbi:MAG TPA: 3-deoxy-manno-octulosonate cytidylyltransferase [Pyrinomonadaceae bacterium]|nr:3-deoxy-manno-octulosonate cytidylyltransferase [Pyrinomonadaceae bacterium]
MNDRLVAVIPARLGSSRFPGKPLAPLLGRPMIEHVLRRAEMCPQLDAVYVATCDDEIKHVVEGLGGLVIMTSASHERATDRVAEAAGQIDAGIVMMIQGDEPMITTSMVAAAITPLLENTSVNCVNLIRRITTREDYLDPNTIKVVMNERNEALYFSRASIPALEFTEGIDAPVFKQVCVIPFRSEFLNEFARWPQTPLERAESIDMLRILEHGGRVCLVETTEETHAVDTPEDLRRVETLMKHDLLIPLYSGRAEVICPGES